MGHHIRHISYTLADYLGQSRTYLCVLLRPHTTSSGCSCAHHYLPQRKTCHPESSRNALPRIPDHSKGLSENSLRGRLTNPKRNPLKCVFFQSRGRASDFCCLNQYLSFSIRLYSTIWSRIQTGQLSELLGINFLSSWYAWVLVIALTFNSINSYWFVFHALFFITSGNKKRRS